MSDDERILVCAVRYALGKMSYVVYDVADYVARRLKTLSDNCLNVIVDAIEIKLRERHALGGKLGMDCDEEMWSQLLAILREEGELREQSRTKKIRKEK